jgi:alginate O-acetyltransferase complex protein AlgI
MFSSGICRFVAGLGKKILIANSMALMADHVFNLSAMSDAYANVPVTLAWLGSVAYTLQIYYDFSGYSDMAIGLGWMFGFRFQENFNYPYVSDSVGEFWRRWHISLTTWFREYVYFPLGGSRISNMDTVAWNSFVVWVLTGMWHGAEWTFLLWGLWNFFFSSLERVTNFARRGIPPLMKHVYLLLVVNIGWVFFRASDLYQAFLFLRNMFGMNDNGFFSATATMFVREYWIFWALGILFSAPVMPRIGKALRDGGLGLYGRLVCAVYPFAVLGLFAVCVAWLVKGSYNPFIYFNF